MRRVIPCILIMALLLTGCSGLLDSSFHVVTRHEEQNSQTGDENISVRNYSGLRSTLISLIGSGSSSTIISVAQYDQDKVDADMERAIGEVMRTDPIAAYAVEDIQYELGTNAGQPAIAVSIAYLHSRTEILRIRRYSGQSQMESAMAESMNSCDAGIVMYVENYEEMDFEQWVSTYAAANPDKVMEVPDVVATLYPEEGTARVVELKFIYQNSRNVLRAMQTEVTSRFEAAVEAVGTEGTQTERFAAMYAYLNDLCPELKLETSITSAYSLLMYGVGDGRTYAQVYAALCNQAGLECIVITGTRAGEPWYWNFVCCDGIYYHVDLLDSRQAGEFAFRQDDDMSGYVWDYSAYTTVVEAEATGE